MKPERRCLSIKSLFESVGVENKNNSCVKFIKSERRKEKVRGRSTEDKVKLRWVATTLYDTRLFAEKEKTGAIGCREDVAD